MLAKTFEIGEERRGVAINFHGFKVETKESVRRRRRKGGGSGGGRGGGGGEGGTLSFNMSKNKTRAVVQLFTKSRGRPTTYPLSPSPRPTHRPTRFSSL